MYGPVKGPARFSVQHGLRRTIGDVYRQLVGERSGLLLVQKPVRGKCPGEAEGLLLQLHDPGHPLFRNLIQPDSISIDCMKFHDRWYDVSDQRGIYSTEKPSHIQPGRAMDEVLVISGNLMVPLSALEFRFSRSGGPGGQHVNKVSSRVVVEYDILHAQELTEEQRQRILHARPSRVGADGILRIASQRSRSQWKNREDAVKKLVEHLQDVLRPMKKRKRTGATIISRERKRSRKQRHARKKMLRRAVTPDD
jgi:ribosome-associated protein